MKRNSFLILAILILVSFWRLAIGYDRWVKLEKHPPRFKRCYPAMGVIPKLLSESETKNLPQATDVAWLLFILKNSSDSYEAEDCGERVCQILGISEIKREKNCFDIFLFSIISESKFEEIEILTHKGLSAKKRLEMNGVLK